LQNGYFLDGNQASKTDQDGNTTTYELFHRLEAASMRKTAQSPTQVGFRDVTVDVNRVWANTAPLLSASTHDYLGTNNMFANGGTQLVIAYQLIEWIKFGAQFYIDFPPFIVEEFISGVWKRFRTWHRKYLAANAAG